MLNSHLGKKIYIDELYSEKPKYKTDYSNSREHKRREFREMKIKREMKRMCKRENVLLFCARIVRFVEPEVFSNGG